MAQLKPEEAAALVRAALCRLLNDRGAHCTESDSPWAPIVCDDGTTYWVEAEWRDRTTVGIPGEVLATMEPSRRAGHELALKIRVRCRGFDVGGRGFEEAFTLSALDEATIADLLRFLEQWCEERPRAPGSP